MGIQKLVKLQYRVKVDSATKQVKELPVVKEGWIRTVRKALGINGSLLAKRAGLAKSRITAIEAGEVKGSTTLKTMQKMADAMDCKFVYTIVPKNHATVGDVLYEKAHEKAKLLIQNANVQMGLEAQGLSNTQIKKKIQLLTEELLSEKEEQLWK